MYGYDEKQGENNAQMVERMMGCLGRKYIL
jgi:hypothetical protein